MLLAFYKAKRYPKLPAGLDTEVGWLVFALLVCVAIWAWSRQEHIKRAIFGGEDPRLMAAMRMMLAVSTIGMWWNLEPYWTMLWSDEGIFTLAEAQQRLGRSALSGWSQEAGFFDAWAVAKFFWEKPSLFLLRCDPGYVYGFMWVYFGLLGLYLVGFRTRLTGLICLLALNSVFTRNALYLEGTDTVYRVLWFMIIFARTDRAWSVDNWLRRRRTAGRDPERQLSTPLDYGLLADRLLSIAWGLLWVWLIARELEVVHMLQSAGAQLVLVSVLLAVLVEARVRVYPRFAEGPERYLLIPRWPRLMMVVQYAFLYTTTGWVKSGAVWARGDALYYAMNMDHFYRFEGVTQFVSAYLGTNVYRLMTWVTHYWEDLFFVVLLGMWLAFRWHHEREPWAVESERSPVRRWTRRLAVAGMWVVLGAIFYQSVPFFFALDKKGEPTMPSYAPQALAWGWFVGVPVLLGLLFALAKWSPTLRIPYGRKDNRRHLEICFDRELIRRWTVGRRLWLTLGVIFHGMLIVAMNIGWFPLIMLGGYLCFLSSSELLRALRALTPARWRDHDALARPDHGDPGGLEERLERQQQGARGDALVDGRWLMLWLAAGVGLAAARAEPIAGFEPRADLVYGVALGLTLVGLVAAAMRREWGWTLAAVGLSFGFVTYGVDMSSGDTELGTKDYAQAVGRGLKVWGAFALGLASWNLLRKRQRDMERPHLMGNSLTRTFILCFCMWHTGAIGAKLMPNFPVWGTWQSPTRRVFGSWLRTTRTSQSWRMFAPNPPRANSFMKTVIVDGDGRYWDLRNNSLDIYPDPFIVNDRMRKMQRRMVGKGKWYLRYWTAYQCRLWELEHGKAPQEVQIYKVTTRIPSPKKTKNKPWSPRKRKRTTTFVQRHKCDERGRPTVDQKRRRGLELDDADRELEQKAREKAEREHETRTKSWARRKGFGGTGDQPTDSTPAKLAPTRTVNPFGTRESPVRTPQPTNRRARPDHPVNAAPARPRGRVGRPASSARPTPNEGTPIEATPSKSPPAPSTPPAEPAAAQSDERPAK